MDAHGYALLAVALGALVLAGTVLARRLGLPEPAVLVVVGLAASVVPAATHLEIPPDLVFLFFLPPLLFRASFLTSPRQLRENLTPLALLSVGLVIATAFAVAGIATVVVPGLGFAQGLVLGAVVSPTDPVAASAVFRRLGAPRRVTDLIEGESLINDATALVLLAVAVQAVHQGAPTPLEATGTLLRAVVGGVAVGLVLAFAVTRLRQRLGEDVGIQLLLSLLVPYVAYVPADTIGASGVLAVVTTGVVLGDTSDGIFTAPSRLPATAVWSLLDLLLNAVLFVLLGLQVRQVIDEIPDLTADELVGSAAAVLVGVTGIRLLWQLLVPPTVYWLRRRIGLSDEPSSYAQRLVVGWTGMRGAVSLAAALSVPLDLPGRPVLLFLTVVVVLGTLLVQGTTLPLVLRLTGLEHEDTSQVERETRLALADVALGRLDDLEASGAVPAGAVSPVRELWEHSRDQVSPDESPQVDLTAVRLEVARVQGEELDRRRRAGGLPPELARALREELDLQEVRLDSSASGGETRPLS